MMSELKPRIHDEQTGLDYVLVGDYYIPAIELPKDDDRPSGNGDGCTGHIWKKQTYYC